MLNFNYMEESRKQFSFRLFEKPTLVIIDWFNIWNKHNDVDLQKFFDYLKSYPEIYQIRFYNGLLSEGKHKESSQKTLDHAESIGFKVIWKKSKPIKIDISKEKHLKNTLTLLEQLLSSITDKNSEIWNKLYTLHEEVEKKISEDLSDSEILDVLDGVESDLKKLNTQIDTFKLEIQKPIIKPKCDFDAEIARDLVLEIDKYQNLILFSGDGDFASTVKYLIEKEKRIFIVYPSGSFGESDYYENSLIYNDAEERKYQKGFMTVPVYRILDSIKKAPADFSTGPDTNNVSDSDLKVK